MAEKCASGVNRQAAAPRRAAASWRVRLLRDPGVREQTVLSLHTLNQNYGI